MSFITKRERVFKDYDLFDLPARNEGKLKAYASCTDARAWSHFCSDKSEHLVEIIKRNNEKCRTKYIPTDVIVDTLMASKNAEITRLRRKIEEFEQMLLAYEELDLTNEQKAEIAAACVLMFLVHASIKAANKELDDLCLDLDLSGYTEGIDSEAFETGKSRGDEPSRYKNSEPANSKGEEWAFDHDQDPASGSAKKETKSNQVELCCTSEASTSATDPRIENMQEDIIVKDAKLSAMQNTIAVMENDICEPYCIYAHIYTALEKIFAILCQNDRYKQYINLLTAGKDTRCIDLKGKILFKLKVFEKFCLALIAPCSQEFNSCCYQTEIVAHIETTFALTSSECRKPSLDNKRAHLVADIIDNEEMKEILDKEITADQEDIPTHDDFSVDNYSVDGENLKRLKKMQENYDDLLNCYESLKHEKDCLEIKCFKYVDLEKELENLRCQLREYNTLWIEKEHYMKRSMDLDALKEQYLVLSDEAKSLETGLKAEIEINKIKCQILDDLRNENILLDKKLNETCIAFEKERNSLLCKLQETECKVMCQEQQIKSLSIQIDRLLEQSNGKGSTGTSELNILTLLHKIESQKEQIQNLKNALLCNEEEKQNLDKDFQDKIKFINELKMEVQEWKSNYKNTLEHNKYLEKYADDIEQKLTILSKENQDLAEEKDAAEANLISIIEKKSEQINKFILDLDRKKKEHIDLLAEYQKLKTEYNVTIVALENEKKEIIESLEVARQESQELLQKVKNYDDIVLKQDEMSKQLESCIQDYTKLQNLSRIAEEENETLQASIITQKNEKTKLLNQLEILRTEIESAKNNIDNLHEEKEHYMQAYELTKKESEQLENKLQSFENLKQKLDSFQELYRTVKNSKEILQNELFEKTLELDSAVNAIKLSKEECSELQNKVQQYENEIKDIDKIKDVNTKLLREHKFISQELENKKNKLITLEEKVKNLEEENKGLLLISKDVPILETELIDLKASNEKLMIEKGKLKGLLQNESEKVNDLSDILDNKNEKNEELKLQNQLLKNHQTTLNNNIKGLERENIATHNTLSALEKESEHLLCKINRYEALVVKFDTLEKAYHEIRIEKEILEKEAINKNTHFNKIEEENRELLKYSQTLLAHSEILEKALIVARPEVSVAQSNPFIQSQYDHLLNEVKEMKKEKFNNQCKIRDYLNELDKMENIISNYHEEILARDDKIAILENHINELEDEVKNLHKCLDKVINTGEELRVKENSYKNLNESLKNIEAHHSKAMHNMKMELIQLHNDNIDLGKQLSQTKIQTEESLEDKQLYIKIKKLENEREIIITDIKQLEIKSVGDSVLSLHNCSTDDILASLDRIKKTLNVKNSRRDFLEQTLLKVQTSSQLLLNKADETKKMFEKEKQKNVSEKEEAIREKLSIERELERLKESLKEQISSDKAVIEDLEAEILNKDLIIDKINENNDNLILKLNEEMRNLKELYESSLKNVAELEKNIQLKSSENTAKQCIINKINLDLQAKSKEIEILKHSLDSLNNTSKRSFGHQIFGALRNVDVQTEQGINYEDDWIDRNNKNESDIGKSLDIDDKSEIKKLKSNFINEVHVLNAEVEPRFNDAKNIYLSYKIKRLGPSSVEHHSVPCITDNDDSQTLNCPRTQLVANNQESQKNKLIISDFPENNNLIDIYNRHSTYTDSSKIINSERETIFASKLSPGTEAKLSDFTDLGLITESFCIKNNIHDSQNNLCALFDYSHSENSTNKDFFVVYQDSENNNIQTTQNVKVPLSSKTPSDVFVDPLTIYPNKHANNYMKNKLSQNLESSKEFNDFKNYNQSFENSEDIDNTKSKLNINLPKLENESFSVITSDDKNSLDSYTLSVHPPRKGNSVSDTNISGNKTKHKLSLPYVVQKHIKNLNSNERDNKNLDKNRLRYEPYKKRKSYNNTITDENIGESTYLKKAIKIDSSTNSSISGHKLLRIDADMLLTNNKESHTDTKGDKNDDIKSFGNFRMNYILDVVQRENHPMYNEIYNNSTSVRQIQSDEVIDKKTSGHADDSSLLRLSAVKFLSQECKSETSYSHSKSYSQKNIKTFSEQGVSVKIDSEGEYENKIQYLTELLETTKRDYKKKIDAIKRQYDNNIKCIINEHNEGVKSIQSIHEETLQDIIKVHENEVENLRSMSIEAMRKTEKLEKENRSLKTKILERNSNYLDEEPIKPCNQDTRRRKKYRDTKTLTKTNVEAFNVKPNSRTHGPCACSLEANVSETIRNIFDQVDVEQRKLAEHTYLKHIANKIINDNVEALDTQELSFLHLKVCKTWKTKVTREEALQKRIDSLENDLMNKQRHAQQHIADLDREVAEERRRLQQLREAVCRTSPQRSRTASPEAIPHCAPPRLIVSNKESGMTDPSVSDRRSAGDIVSNFLNTGIQPKRFRMESHRAVLAKMDSDERRERKHYNDEPPTRLRRSHDRQTLRSHKKP